MRIQFSILLMAILLATVPETQAQTDSDNQAKIKSATSAAPSSVTADAKILDWDGTVLREGSNEWTCYPDMPDLPAQNPMCLDQQWMNWLQAYMNQETPNITEVGLGYMLQGGAPNSNLDPFPKGPTPDNQWMEEVAPHVMILLPDEEMYKDLSTDPGNGGPWVMFPETPYAHIMMPAAQWMGK